MPALILVMAALSAGGLPAHNNAQAQGGGSAVATWEGSRPKGETPPSGEPFPDDIVLVGPDFSPAVLVVPDEVPDYLYQLAVEFVETVEMATGVRIQVLGEGNFEGVDSRATRIYLGDTGEARLSNMLVENLPEEGFEIFAEGNRIIIIGRDRQDSRPGYPSSMPTRWALNHLLEEGLGVRWLWPGRLGTYIPKSDRFVVMPMKIAYQPDLKMRRLRLNPNQWLLSDDSELNARLQREAAVWAMNHQHGQQSGASFGHAFIHWWDRYGKNHPDYFAELPPDVEQPFPREAFVKLRLSNPDVIDSIAEEYQAAGAPEFWNVCPNDGGGFDISSSTLEWDLPKGQSIMDIHRGRAELTARYVQFWNLLSEKLREINPDVKLSTYAYLSYRKPPPAERPLTAPSAIALVPGYYDYDLWLGWAEQPGVQEVYLRPNWGHLAAHAPYLPLEEMADFLEFGWINKMTGFDLDALIGFWSTQGSLYYLWARMLYRPDLTLNEILAEYTSAFGSAAPIIDEYLDYWQRISKDYAIVDPYALEQPGVEEGQFFQLVKEGKTEINFVRGSRRALPYLYTDEVLAPAYALLDEAESKLVEGNEREAAERVSFLRDGLDELVATRDLIEFSQKIDKSSSADIRELQARSDDLQQLREALSGSHAVWGGRLTHYENHYRVTIRPSNMDLPTIQMDGM